MKQDTLRRLDSQSLKQLRMSQRELNHLPDLLDHGSQTANVLVTDLRNRTNWFLDLFTDKNLRSLSNNHGFSGRTRISHNQIDSPSHDIDRNEVSPRQNRPSRSWLRYSSPPTIRSGSVGANVKRSAIFASIFRIVTLSSMEPPALFLR